MSHRFLGTSAARPSFTQLGITAKEIECQKKYFPEACPLGFYCLFCYYVGDGLQVLRCWIFRWLFIFDLKNGAAPLVRPKQRECSTLLWAIAKPLDACIVTS